MSTTSPVIKDYVYLSLPKPVEQWDVARSGVAQIYDWFPPVAPAQGL